jgi:DNA-binding transcriptional regulator GbsR (MarR family)
MMAGTNMDRQYEQFIETWGSMGVLWGINRSMARIHAFLITCEEPCDLDTIADSLKISRGNASMCLKELRHWGVIRRVHSPGERRDFYVTEPDAFKMFYLIGQERKKREFDPALNSVRLLLAEGDPGKDKQVRARLRALERLLTTIDKILNKCLGDEKMTKAVLNILKGFVAK